MSDKLVRYTIHANHEPRAIVADSFGRWVDAEHALMIIDRLKARLGASRELIDAVDRRTESTIGD